MRKAMRAIYGWVFGLVRSLYARMLPAHKQPADRLPSESTTDVADGGAVVKFEPEPDRRWGKPELRAIRLDPQTDRVELSASRVDRSTIEAATAYDVIDDPESGAPGWIEVGEPGTRYATGLPVGHERNSYFRPVKVRGQTGDVGRYRQLARSSPTFYRGWKNIAQGLGSVPWREWQQEGTDSSRARQQHKQSNGPDRAWEWRIIPSAPTPEARRRARKLEESLQTLHDGWRQFVTEFLTALIDGFCIFEPVFYPPGHELHGLPKRLAFREQSTVQYWVHDERGRDLEGIVFQTAEERYTLGAREMLVYSHLRTGNQWEGNPPTRQVARHIEAVQEYMQTQLVSAEIWGAPWSWTRPDPDAGQLASQYQDQIEEQVTQAVAAERPHLQLPYGVEMDMTSPEAQQPDQTEKIDQHREMILNSLKAEHALMGVRSVGARAAREAADDENVRQIPFYGMLLAEAMNGGPSQSHDGVLAMATDRRWGGPVGDHYPSLELYIYPDDRIEAADWSSLQQSGFVEPTPEVRKEVHRRLDLPPPNVDGSDEGGAEGPGPAEAEPEGEPEGAGVEADRDLSPKLEIHAQQNLDRAERGFDAADSKAKRALQEVAVEHRKWARERIDSVNTTDDLRGFSELAEQRFKNQYVEALEEAYREGAKKGAVDVARDFGVTIADEGDGIDLPSDKRDVVDAVAMGRGREMFNRQQGLIEEVARNRIAGGADRQIAGLAESTVESMARRGAGRAYRAGRSTVTERADEIVERSPQEEYGKIKAERINPLDEDTCDPCERWHGLMVELGSTKYHRATPPGAGRYECEGGEECRCIWTYIPPPDMPTSVFRAVINERVR